MDGQKAPDPPWWVSRPMGPGEAGPRQAIVEAALQVADAEGLGALSLRRLAAEVGVAKNTVVWHVGSKEQLLDLLLDRVIGEVVPPDPETAPREALESLARGLRTALLEHRKVAPLVGDRPGIGPNSLALIEMTLRALLSAGLSAARAVDGYVALLTYVNGFALWEGRNLETAQAIGPELYAATVHGYLSRLPTDHAPSIVRAAQYMTDGNFADRFDRGLAWILDGILEQSSSP